MSQKRGASFNHYGDRGQPFNKRPKPNDTHRSAPSSNRYRSGHPKPHHSSTANPNANRTFKNKDNPVLDHISRLPEPEHCTPCQLAAAEMQTGMISLLDKLVADEISTHGNRDILHHARELHRLLSSRTHCSLSSKSVQDLDQKRPNTSKLVSIPIYVDQKINQAKDLPRLPNITEPSLQQAVFTHNSHNADTRGKGVNTDQNNYERLEFLGDAYIELIASRLLYSRFPHLDVPQQSALRENLVKNETLGKFSEAYGLPDRLKHGGHIKESKAWTKIIADVFEAYVAAIVLSDYENGFSTAETWLTELWAPQLLAYKENIIENPRARDDLQKKLLIKGVKLDYREEKPMMYVDGLQKYFMAVYLTGWGYEDEWLGSGEGQNKMQGCIAAATDAMQRENDIYKDSLGKKEEMVAQRKKEQQMQDSKTEAGKENNASSKKREGDGGESLSSMKKKKE